MQTKFKRHQKVRLLLDPDPEYVEFYSEEEVPIKKGAIGKVNIILPNGKYHVEIVDEKDKTLAYVLMDEDYLEERE